MKTCKQCGYQIVAGGRPMLDAIQATGFCSGGCQETYLALKAWIFSDALNAA